MQKRYMIMNNNMLRRRIIGAAAECFLKYGIKNTSMNFISEILHISKRTLYQSFPSKRDLLKACVTFRLETSRRRIEGRCDSAGPIEAIVCMNYGAYAFSRMFYPAFRKDIPKYPDALVLFEEEYRTPLCKMCYGHFEEAKRMRLIQPESNFEFAFQFFEKTLLTVPSGDGDENRQAEIYTNAILTYLAGICTGEGRERLNNVLVEIQYENEDKFV